MNERIESLAKQSGYKHPNAVGQCEDYAYFDHNEFAELIVQECIQLVRKNHASPHGVQAIMKHFGVE